MQKQYRDSTNREQLIDKIPLNTPLCINVEASSACNLSCRYCIQSSSSVKEKIHLQEELMDFITFQKLIEGCKSLPRRIKNIRFAGFGEPLLNNRLEDMVELAKKNNVCDAITIFTNAVLLDENRITRLIKSGVDRFVIDVQGTKKEHYMEYCKRTIDFEKLKKNIEYLYANKKDVEVYIKTYHFMDSEEALISTWGNYCDYLSIEDVFEIIDGIDYSGMLKNIFLGGER